MGPDAASTKAVLSQLKRGIRTIYSSPSAHGAALVAGVLTSPELKAMWEQELTGMRERIHALRAGLVDKLAALGAPEFGFINQQAGMFSYSGLTRPQVDRLRDEYGIYAVGTGRICVAALSQNNLDYVANAVATVSRGGSRPCRCVEKPDAARPDFSWVGWSGSRWLAGTRPPGGLPNAGRHYRDGCGR